MPDHALIKKLDALNRKLHVYVGLFLLLFIWLFSATGLLLNHPQWTFAQFWPQRQTSATEQPVEWPAGPDDVQRAESLMRQVHVSGEIEGITLSADGRQFDVRVVKPGAIIDIKTDRATKRARVEQISVNVWGTMNMLHSFTGVRMSEPDKKREWIMTRLWSLAMDGLSVGLVLLVLGGLAIWIATSEKRQLGLVILLTGVVSCGLFVLGKLP
ncbi:MAG: PepSY-associated TM helix domain-containing protein [Planctomycetota bacterium]|jgi:hypothetical protein